MRKAFDPKRFDQRADSSAEMRAALQGFRLITPHIEYQNKTTLNVGERTFELTYIKNVHSESDSAIWLPKERVLFPAASVGVKRVNKLRPSVTIPATLAASKMMRALTPDSVSAVHG